MSVRVRFFATFRELFEARERDVSTEDAATVGTLIERLGDTPRRKTELCDGQSLQPHLLVMINGAPVPPSGFAETPLKDGDIVSIFPLMGGG